MSFKREGNDKSQLNILKKRRVADLLSNFIPEDEAALLKNGRYTCLVCSYRPVFDTVDTLTVHRNGKRHLQGLKAFYGKKAVVKNEITKRRQETFIQAEDGRQEAPGTAPLLEKTRVLTHHALLRSRPYDSRHWRTSTKGGKARTGPVSDPSRATLAQEGAGRAAEGSSASSLPDGPSEPEQADQRDDEPMTEQRRRELEHYLKLKSAGWVQDPSGCWTKDENVEFDSDEEEPPSLEPTP